VLDTSVLIAGESGRALAVERIPEEVAASVITLAELRAGVLVAADAHIRARRLATLETLSDIEVIPIDRHAAEIWALLRVHLAEAGRRLNVNDLWIAASAASRGLPVVTQDADFDPVDGVAGVAVIRV
jgi:predicted nucleic acid-binding protein